MHLRTNIICVLLAIAAVVIGNGTARAQGFILSGAGPVNRSMGGASVAAPLDATGALYWNPATMSGLDSSQLDFGAEILYPRETISSRIPANAIGPGSPAGPMSGSTQGDAGVFMLPTAGFVFKPEGSPWAFGLGLFPLGGFGTNTPGSASNPILSSPPPHGYGLGPIASNLQILELAPEVSYQITDRLSVGFGPTIGAQQFTLNPGVLFTPAVNEYGVLSYPEATNTRFYWGGGVQAGLYWKATDDWNFGASFKSPMWFESYRYQSSLESGQPRTVSLNVDTPMIVSIGTSYTGIDRLTLALDLRYLDFNTSALFNSAGFNSTGALAGLGWTQVFALALGGQYQLTEKLSVRAGYTYNTNPIPAKYTAINVASPLIFQHQLTLGASYQLTEKCLLSAAYIHYFENSITGPYITPSGSIPGGSVTTNMIGDSLVVGITCKF
jgi:long-chain fatty acid transport protein